MAWRTTPPKNAAEASRLVLEALQGQLRTDVLVNSYIAFFSSLTNWL